jgi:hypothetical protein
MMPSRLRSVVTLLAVLALLRPAPGGAEPPTIAVVQDRVYRADVYLAIDALVQNVSARGTEAVEVSVEFYNFFDELISVEHTLVAPTRLGPSQVGALRVVTLHHEALRKVQYRFTWRQDGEQRQAVERRLIWAMGAPTRLAGPSR